MYLNKGDRVRVEILQADDPPGSLAGAQLKFTAKKFVLTGVVRHVRGDAPTTEASTDIRIWVEPEGPIPEGLRTDRCDRCSCREIPALPPSVVKEVFS